MLNQCNFMGRLVVPPAEFSNDAGTKMANFRIAVDNGTFKGEKQTLFLEAWAYRQQAELVLKNFTKGSCIIVGGRLTQKEYVKRDGSKGVKYELAVNSIEFPAGSKRENEGEKAPEQAEEVSDDELPF